MSFDLPRFGIQVGSVLALGWLIAAYPLHASGDPGLVTATAVGSGIALVNVILGCLSAVWAFDKPQPTFLKMLFGGMTVRLLAMGAAFGVLVHFTDIDPVGLTFSLFGFYVLFQIVEVRFLASALKGRRGPEQGR